MSQSDVLEVLRKNKRPVSRTDIAIALKCDPIIVSHSIKRLVNSDSIKVIEIDRHQAKKYYNCKRRMRLYYI